MNNNNKQYKIHTPKGKELMITTLGAICIMGMITASLVLLSRLF